MTFQLSNTFPVSAASLIGGVMRAASLALFLAAIVLAGWWITQWISPRPVATLATSSSSTGALDPDDALHLFGVVARGGAESPAAGGLELTGVYAYGDGKGFAILRAASGPMVVFAGQEAMPGIRLSRVDGNGVVLTGRGHDTTLRLPVDSGSRQSPTAPPPAAQAPVEQTPAVQSPAAPAPAAQAPVEQVRPRPHMRARAPVRQQESE